MEDKEKEQLEELIKEGEYFNDKFSLTTTYKSPMGELKLSKLPKEYLQKHKDWVENVRLWTSWNYNSNYKKVYGIIRAIDFDRTDTDHSSLLSTLKAMLRNPPKKELFLKEKSNNDTLSNNVITINQSQNQFQEQSQEQRILQEIFIEAINEELAEEQAQELKSILDEHKGDIEKAKPKLKEKLLSFGGNILSGIITNILTNPNMIGLF